MWWEQNDQAKNFLNIFKESAGKKNIILILGAGITADIYPTWTQLLKDMLNDLINKKSNYLSDTIISQINNCIQDGSFLDAANFMKRLFGESDYFNFLQNKFRNPDEKFLIDKLKNVNRRIKNLNHLLVEPQSPIWAAITTNFDGLTSNIAPTHDKWLIWMDNKQAILSCIRNKTSFLWHFHGHINNHKSLILTNEDFTGSMLNESINQLGTLIQNNIIIYMGYSFCDQDIKFVIDNIIYKSGLSSDNQFILFPCPSKNQEEYKKFEKKIDINKLMLINRNISIIEYDPINNHQQLDEFIQELSNIVQSIDINEYINNIKNIEIIPSHKSVNNVVIQYSDLVNVFFTELGQGLSEKTIRKLNYKELEKDLIEKNERILIVGEAGVGKTTLSRTLRKNIAQANKSGIIIPLLISLRNKQKKETNQTTLYEIDCYTVLDYHSDLSNLLRFKETEKIKFVIILDGLNEIDDNSRKKIILSMNEFSKKFKQISILFTSRSVSLSEEVCSLCDNLKIYELQRWTKNQLITYFHNNSIEQSSSFVEKLSPEMFDALRLPLFAWIYLQISQSTVARSVSDIFDHFLQKFINPRDNEKEKFSGINIDYPISDYDRNLILYTIAYKMTQKNTLTITGEDIERSLMGNNSIYFREFILHLLNAGIFRSVDIPIIDHQADIQLLRTTRFNFLHQAFQEYLTAKYLQNHKEWYNIIPKDLSINAFWRDIPHYMMFLINQSENRENAELLVEKFIEIEDFWTAARLANDLFIRTNDFKQRISKKLIQNLSIANTYPKTKNAFSELGNLGKNNLLEILKQSDALTKIIAWPELYLFDENTKKQIIKKYISQENTDEQSIEEYIERIWRTHGRAITILGELNEIKLIDVLLDNLKKIKSYHLIYHIMEAFLMILQSIELEAIRDEYMNKIRSKLIELTWEHHENPIIAAYSILFINRKDPNIQMPDKEIQAVKNLEKFLKEKYDNVDKNKNFNNEFWQRAHAFLILSEISSFEIFYSVCQYAIEIECNVEKTPYFKAKFEGFRAVLPSIMEGLLKMLISLKLKFEDIQTILEIAVVKPRFSESGWALNKLEILLFNSRSEMQKLWLDKIIKNLDEPELANTKQVINNIIHSFQF